MKIIITVSSPDIKADLDARFGRGAYFLVIDTQTLDWQAHSNPGINAPGGAGIQAAQFAAEYHVEAIVSGDFGPNAFSALNAAGISMYLFGACRNVQEVIANLKAERLERVGAAARPDRHAVSGARA